MLLLSVQFASSSFTLLFGWQEGHPVCKNEWWILAWLSVWSELQICMCPSGWHCHPLSLAPVNPDCFYLCCRLTQVVLDKGPLNMCVCVSVSVYVCACVCLHASEYNDQCICRSSLNHTAERQHCCHTHNCIWFVLVIFKSYCYWMSIGVKNTLICSSSFFELPVIDLLPYSSNINASLAFPLPLPNECFNHSLSSLFLLIACYIIVICIRYK